MYDSAAKRHARFSAILTKVVASSMRLAVGSKVQWWQCGKFVLKRRSKVQLPILSGMVHR